MKIILSAVACLFALSAYAADPPPKAPPVDFMQVVKNPKGVPLKSCADQSNPDCARTILGELAYMALSAPLRDPKGQSETGNPADAALGWKIMSATEPLYVTDSEKARIVAAIRRQFDPGSAYAGCRLLINPDDCEKP